MVTMSSTRRLSDADYRIIMRVFGFHDATEFRFFVADQQKKHERTHTNGRGNRYAR